VSARLERAALALLALSAASVAAPALLAPRAFYDDFPFVASWVDRLPPYNEHLIIDVGAFYLAFTVLFAWAAWAPRRALVVPVCVAWSVFAAVHLAFHAAHLHGWPAGDAIAELASLALVLALGPVAIALGRRPQER
jgi:hypothetical protein